MDNFIGQIITTGYNFAQRGFALCEGQLLNIADNNALFALLGDMYGGDLRTTFGIPDLRTGKRADGSGEKEWAYDKPRYQICLEGIFPSRS